MHLDKVKSKTFLLVLNKTQSEIAQNSGLSQRWVGAAFNGRSISEKTARRIAAALGVDVASIVKEEN